LRDYCFNNELVFYFADVSSAEERDWARN